MAINGIPELVTKILNLIFLKEPVRYLYIAYHKMKSIPPNKEISSFQKEEKVRNFPSVGLFFSWCVGCKK